MRSVEGGRRALGQVGGDEAVDVLACVNLTQPSLPPEMSTLSRSDAGVTLVSDASTVRERRGERGMRQGLTPLRK
eukprot:6177499-Pleurochrysis_carterae.AAC.1